MSFGGGEGSRREESASTERRPRSRNSALLLVLLVLLLGLLLLGAFVLWRSLGDSLSGTATAGDALDSGPDPNVRLTNGAGQIRVEGVPDLRSVEYEATKHAFGPDPATAKQRASDVKINFSREEGDILLESGGGDDTGVDYVLRVPDGASVEVGSEAGKVEVEGVNGDITVRAEAGDVTIRGARGSISVESPRGDVEISGARTDTGQAEISVGTGDLTLDDLIVGTLEASVEAGDVFLLGRFSGGGRISVETGDIVDRLPSGDTRELTLEAGIGEVMREGEPSGGRKGSEQRDGGS